MRLKNKSFFVILFIAVFSTLVLIGVGSAGLIKHDIYSPFKIIVDSDSQEYPSGIQKESTQRIVASKYNGLEEYPSSLAGNEGDGANLGEPFCMVGGQYMVNVLNDPSPGAGIQEWNMKLYYCKTTFDLLERVKVPSSWSNSDLIVYCNDGGNIIANNTNFDYITSQVNTYKLCVIRNLDLDKKNTLIFGYDVGNKVVDDDESYFFRNTSQGGYIGSVLVDDALKFVKVNSETTGSDTAYMGKYKVPYKLYTETTGSGENERTITEYRPRNEAEAKEYLLGESALSGNLDLSNPTNVVVETDCSNVNVRDGDICTPQVSADSYTVYTVRAPYTYIIGEYMFNHTKLDTIYYFGYDFNDGFYYMKDFGDSLDTPILDIFSRVKPTDIDIGISRVALLKKEGNKYIYGYETASNDPSISTQEPYNRSVKPVYKIKLSSNFGMTNSVCVDSLKKYLPNFGTFDANTGVSCRNNEISIVSLNLNTKEADSKYAFHLFKNIVTSLE